MTDDKIPQFAWPPVLVSDGAGGFSPATVEQDSDDDVRSNATRLSEIRPGQLVWAKATGTPSPLGDIDPDLAALLITSALGEQETRATVVARVVDLPGTPRDIRLRLVETA